MVKCLSEKRIGHPRKVCKVNDYNGYWTVKRTQVISHNKVIALLAYIILSNSVTHLNAQPCSLCKLNHTSPASRGVSNKDPKGNYEEFIFEHQITRQDAIDALQTLNQSFFDGPPESSCKSIACTRNVMRYCYGPQFINDHCWCELGHANEGLPFIPHICYVGEKQYEASVGSCFFYEEVKECCCAPALAKRWRHISAGTTITAFSCVLTLTLAILTTLRQRV